MLTKLRGRFYGTLAISLTLVFLLNGAASSSAASSIDGDQSPGTTIFPLGSDLQTSEIVIPAQSDWSEQGRVLERGPQVNGT